MIRLVSRVQSDEVVGGRKDVQRERRTGREKGRVRREKGNKENEWIQRLARTKRDVD